MKSKIKIWLRFLLTAIVVLFAIKGMYCNYIEVEESPSDGMITFLDESSTLVPHGVNLYMDANENAGINAVQSHVLLFEWYLDAKYQRGGLEGFISDQKGYYFELLSEKNENDHMPGTEVVYETDQYRIVGHSSVQD